ncbi:AGD9 [Symbiodinium sp. CCMP2592]|nr:AGD9 [Symbiodinium sp. CCMP2592]
MMAARSPWTWTGSGLARERPGMAEARQMDGKGKYGKEGNNKGKDGKGKAKDGKGKGGKNKDGKGYSQGSQWTANAWNDPEACRICGKHGHGKWECAQATGKGKGSWKGQKGKMNQVEQQPTPSSASSVAPSIVSITSPPSASVYRGNASVNVIEAYVMTPPGAASRGGS